MAVNPQIVDDLMLILTQLKEGEGDGYQEKRGRGRPTRKGKVGGTSGAATEGGGGSAVSKAVESLTVDGSDINSVLQALLTIVSAQVEDQRRLKAEQDRRFEDIENRVREQGDKLDEIQQRGLKGNLMISSPTNGGKQSLLKTPAQLEEEGVSVLDHVRELVRTKYNVDLPARDVQACHHVPSWPKGRKGQPEYKSVVLRIWNRTNGSAWSALVAGIMSGGVKEVNVYANFHLTKQRSDLLYHLRKLKEAKKITKFYTNENGHISYRVSEKSMKMKVTYFSTEKGSNPITLTPDELINKFK